MGPWVEAGGVLWREEVFRGTLGGGRRYFLGPDMEEGGAPWDPRKHTFNLPLINNVPYGGVGVVRWTVWGPGECGCMFMQKV